jgi:hypothetical protein
MAARRNEEVKRMKNNAHPEVAADRQSTSDNPSSWPGTTPHTTGEQSTVEEASSYQQLPAEGSSYPDAHQWASQERQQDLPNPTTEQPTPRGEDDTVQWAGVFDGPTLGPGLMREIMREFVPEATPYGSDTPAASSPNPKAKRHRPTLGPGLMREIMREFVPEATPYGSDTPAASSPNPKAKRPRARFQLGSSDDSDDGDQSLPTNSVAIAPHHAEREGKKARGRKSELRVHPSNDQADRDVPSLPDDWEFKYDDDGNRDKPSPTPSPRASTYYYASGTTPARPATRAHFRHESSGAFDFSPRPPASSPRYTSMGQYAIATGNGSSSGVTEFQVPKSDDDMTDYDNPVFASFPTTPVETHETLQPSWEHYPQEEAFSENANPLRRQNHVDFPTGLPHETATMPNLYPCPQCDHVFDQLHKLK